MIQLADFDWVRAGPSPNWALLPADQQLSPDQLNVLDEVNTADEVLKALLPS